MKLHGAILMLGALTPIAAQDGGPIGILRGELVSWTGNARAGAITFRNVDSRISECSFDDKTWFERENERIAVSGAHAGDHLEIVADRRGLSTGCYARTVQVLDVLLPRRNAAGKPRFASHNTATELLAPRGDMTFSGIVTAIDEDRLTLRTRNSGPQTLLLRMDTRYLGGGMALDRSSLARQTLVFVRAGHNLDGDVEAYTIVWGELLEVRN